MALEAAQLASIEHLQASAPVVTGSSQLQSPIVKRSTVAGDDVVCRLAGDHFLLVELGPQELDIDAALQSACADAVVRGASVPGIRELTPGIRSLQIHYDSQHLSLA